MEPNREILTTRERLSAIDSRLSQLEQEVESQDDSRFEFIRNEFANIGTDFQRVLIDAARSEIQSDIMLRVNYLMNRIATVSDKISEHSPEGKAIKAMRKMVSNLRT
jgi:DNA-binding GntR family transcriptional regulator